MAKGELWSRCQEAEPVSSLAASAGPLASQLTYGDYSSLL